MAMWTLSLLLLLRPTAAMFEDQADNIDWYRQNLGRATHALFHSANTQRLAIIATELSVLAALDLRSGSIAWRQVLPVGESVTALQTNGKVLLSLSSTPAGAFVRLWSMQGALLWDALLPKAGVQAMLPPHALFAGPSVVVAWGESVTAFDYAVGDVAWRWLASAGDEEVQMRQLLLLPEEEQLQAFGVLSSGSLIRATLNAKDGSLVAHKALGSHSSSDFLPRSQMVVAFDQASVAWLKGATLLQHMVGSDAIVATRLDSLLPSLGGLDAARLLPLTLPGMLALAVPAHGGAPSATVLLSVRGGGAVVVDTLRGELHLAHAVSREGKATLARIEPTTSGMELRVMAFEPDAKAGAWSEAESLPYSAAEHGTLVAAWLNSYARKDGSLGHRLLLSSQDDALQLVQAAKDGGRVAWVREEGLASVQGSTLVPMPSLVTDADAEGPHSFAFALPGLLLGLQRRWREAAAMTRPAADEPAPRHADPYGTRQVLVLHGGAKVFGLHTSSGELLWAHWVGPLRHGAPSPEVKEVFMDGHKVWALAQDEAQFRVLCLNAHDGHLLSESSSAGEFLHVSKLRLDDGASGLLLLDSSLSVSLYPDTPAVRRAVHARVDSLFFYLLFKAEAAPSLRGYGLRLAADAEDAALVRPFELVPRWALALPSSVELSSTGFPANAVVGSPVRVLGDRSIMHKYVNRNLLALGLATPQKSPEEAYVQVMLVDTVSGVVVHSARHSGCSAPLTLVMADHWLIYHYWCGSQNHYQMTATELYSNSTLTDDPIGLLLGGPLDYTDRANMFDAFAPAAAKPHVISQTYAFGTGVAAMGVTLTAAGLTSKSVILATTAGQLVAINKNLLDPRRPLVHPSKMRQHDREEGLIPYASTLGGINPLTILTHRHTVARPAHVLTAPTTLESTSLVVGVGLDLFLTRTAPAREFDRLNDDFNYVALVGAIAFLIVATLGSGWYSKRRDLLAAWS